MKSANHEMPKGGFQKQSNLISGNEELQGLRQLFLNSLKDVYWSEKALTKALPKMIKNTTNQELSSALSAHLVVTGEHLTRLEEVFVSIGERAAAKRCPAMEGIIKEAEEIMESTKIGPVRDAGIISAGQKAEHYEIATYGTLCCFAKTLGETEAAEMLHQTLRQEKEADEKLSSLAESCINADAASGDKKRGTTSMSSKSVLMMANAEVKK